MRGDHVSSSENYYSKQTHSINSSDLTRMNSQVNIGDFNLLFKSYYTPFLRFAMGYVKDKQTAEDFVSEAFTVYWEKKNELLPDTNPPAFILTIVKNKCINYLHHQTIELRVSTEIKEHAEWVRAVRLSTLEACDPEGIFSREIEEIVRRTLEKLPPKTARIYTYSRKMGFSYKEIAELTQMSQKSIEFHISKALRHLRDSLKDYIILLFCFFI